MLFLSVPMLVLLKIPLIIGKSYIVASIGTTNIAHSLTSGFIRVNYFVIEKINTLVSVAMSFDCHRKIACPVKIFWSGRTYQVSKMGLHHTHRKGRTLFHIYSVIAENLFFKLELDTDNLFWYLREVSDGLPS